MHEMVRERTYDCFLTQFTPPSEKKRVYIDRTPQIHPIAHSDAFLIIATNNPRPLLAISLVASIIATLPDLEKYQNVTLRFLYSNSQQRTNFPIRKHPRILATLKILRRVPITSSFTNRIDCSARTVFGELGRYQNVNLKCCCSNSQQRINFCVRKHSRILATLKILRRVPNTSYFKIGQEFHVISLNSYQENHRCG